MIDNDERNKVLFVAEMAGETGVLNKSL